MTPWLHGTAASCSACMLGRRGISSARAAGAPCSSRRAITARSDASLDTSAARILPSSGRWSLACAAALRRCSSTSTRFSSRRMLVTSTPDGRLVSCRFLRGRGTPLERAQLRRQRGGGWRERTGTS